MKISSKPTLVQLPPNRKSSYPIFGSLTALAAGLALLGGPSSALAQADNFNDGNDTAPTIAWIHNDPIFQASGGAVAGMAYSFPGGNTYKLVATDPLGGAAGPARGGSTVGNDLTSFYISVDVVGWDPLLYSAFGILARITDPGLQTTKGYAFTYQSDDNDVQISVITGEAPSEAVGSGNLGITLDPLKQYRLVFQGVGANLEGRVYDLADLSVPLVVVYANDATYSHGDSGLVVYDNDTALSGGSAGATFDNFFSAADCPDTAYSDDFADSNDTTPAPAWVHVDPLTALGGAYAGGTFTFPNQDYRLFSPVPDVDAAGGPRVYSIRNDRDYSDFFVSVDVSNWDSAAHILFGIIARGKNFGPGTTDGYVMSWENGDGSPGDGDFDLLRIAGEGTVDASQMEHDYDPEDDSGYHLNDGTSYRFTFAGSGTNFVARIYQLPDTYTPVKTIHAVDDTPGGSFVTSGKVGVVVFDHPAEDPYHSVFATFDNFFADVAEPRLSFDGSSGSAVISWPGTLTCLWVLESSPTLGPTAVWTQVPLGDDAAVTIVYSPETHLSTYTAPDTMTASGNMFYRLRKL